METQPKKKPAFRGLLIAGLCLIMVALLLVVYFCSYNKSQLNSGESPAGTRTLSVYKVGTSLFSGTRHLLVCAGETKLFDFSVDRGDGSAPVIEWLDDDRVQVIVQGEEEVLYCHLSFAGDTVTVGWYELADGDPHRPACQDMNVISDRVQFEGFTVPDWTAA